MGKEALIILHPNFEEIEAIATIDLLRRAQIIVHISSTNNSLEVIGKSGLSIKADSFLSYHQDKLYDALIIPGGPGIFKIRNDILVRNFLRQYHSAEKCIACICAAPILLLDYRLHEKFKISCHPSIEERIPNISTEETSVDGHIITSRGAGTSISFALAIIKYLKGKETAKTISNDICYRQY